MTSIGLFWHSGNPSPPKKSVSSFLVGEAEEIVLSASPLSSNVQSPKRCHIASQSHFGRRNNPAKQACRGKKKERICLTLYRVYE